MPLPIITTIENKTARQEIKRAAIKKQKFAIECSAPSKIKAGIARSVIIGYSALYPSTAT